MSLFESTQNPVATMGSLLGLLADSTAATKHISGIEVWPSSLWTVPRKPESSNLQQQHSSPMQFSTNRRAAFRILWEPRREAGFFWCPVRPGQKNAILANTSVQLELPSGVSDSYKSGMTRWIPILTGYGFLFCHGPYGRNHTDFSLRSRNRPWEHYSTSDEPGLCITLRTATWT